MPHTRLRPCHRLPLPLIFFFLANAVLFVGTCLAQGTFVSFNGPMAGTQSGGTFPSVINRWGGIGLATIDDNGITRAYVRHPNGTYFQIQPPGATNTYLDALTSQGQVAGTFVDSQSQQHGYVRNTDGTYVTLNPPGSTQSFVIGMNEAGQVVGEAFVDIDKAITSFFWDPTQPNAYVTIEVPGEIGTSPTAINDSGQIAGVYLESTTRKRKGFLRGSDGTFALFEIGTSTNLQVLALNDRGTIVGSSFKLGITTGYLRYSGNGRKFFGAQANGRPWSSAINDNGLVVGWFSYSDGSSDVAFSMDRNLTPEPIPVPFSNQSTRAIGVDNAGQIVGAFVDANGIPHGWLYLP